MILILILVIKIKNNFRNCIEKKSCLVVVLPVFDVNNVFRHQWKILSCRI